MVRKKIFLIGDFNVGKTSVIKQYITHTFHEKTLDTIGMKISKKQFFIDNKTYELLLCDLEGSTLDGDISKTYYNGMDGAIFVADASRHESMKGLKRHINMFEEINPGIPYLIAYNKIDILDKDQQKLLGTEENIFLTSAKNNMNIDELFTAIAKKIFNN